MVHINQRGPHTTVIEGAMEIIKLYKKVGVEVSPGVIIANARAKGKSVKLKKLNDHTFEMVVVVNSSKQTFKVYGIDQDHVFAPLVGLKKNGWNVQEVLDISMAE